MPASTRPARLGGIASAHVIVEILTGATPKEVREMAALLAAHAETLEPRATATRMTEAA